MTQLFRVPNGGLIDRETAVQFAFDGKSYQGYAGDTLASALLANGVRLVGRSFKYHRPRGILSAGAEEPNALCELRGGARREPNTRMTTAEIFDGLCANSQNRYPSLNFDLLAVISLAGPVFSAGFYYKTFMWPASFWEKLYEPMIRRAAGLGRAAPAPDPDTYEKATAFCDVLVIGAGAAGIAAALAAAHTGARVILCEEDFVAGGRLHADRRQINGYAASQWADTALADLCALPNVTLMVRTAVVAVYDGGTYAALQRVSDHLITPLPHQPRQRLWRIVAKHTVLAAGAIERPLVFGGNDKPGVMLAGSVRTYINRFAVRPGTRAVVFANNDDAARTVADLAESGITVVAFIDPRPAASEFLRASLATSRVPLITGVVDHASGFSKLSAVHVRTENGKLETLSCDLLAMSGGFMPNIHLTTHLGGKPVWQGDVAAFVPGTLPPTMLVAGAATGEGGLAAGIAQGARAGADAAHSAGFVPVQFPAAITVLCTDDDALGFAPLWHVDGRGKAFIDFQNDVTATDVKLAAVEGFRSVEHLKRYTTLGMATDQGKTANVNGLALMAEITERTIAQTGTTRFRPPYAPVAIGALAGHHRGAHFRATRLTPTHAWATGQGAVFTDAGQWKRAQYFPAAAETDWLDATIREVRSVRASVGICDVTTLGKIDIQGADAAEFLEHVYTNSWKNLAIGRARYGLMLREDGFVLDDGTTARLSDDRYIMTTTTANAARVFQHLEFCRQVLWSGYDVHLISATEAWAQIAVAGPRAREVLRKLIDPAYDISNEAFPYMAAGEVTLCGGVMGRLFRLSFSGELAYEIAVPARFGQALAEALMAAGDEFSITPYGLEALAVMRIEKGHAAGAELNGTTTAHDLGLAKLLSRKKDFVGRVMAERPALTDAARPGLVGFRPLDTTARVRGGAQFLPPTADATAANAQGHVTSAAFSPHLGQWIGLGLLTNGATRHGEVLRAYDPVRGNDTQVEIVPPVFYDVQGTRLHG